MEITVFQGSGEEPGLICLQNIELNARAKGTNPKSTISGSTIAIKQFHKFVNSRHGLESEISLNDLIEEARVDIRQPKVKIRNFFIWLMGENAEDDEKETIEDYEPFGKNLKRTSACIGDIKK